MDWHPDDSDYESLDDEEKPNLELKEADEAPHSCPSDFDAERRKEAEKKIPNFEPQQEAPPSVSRSGRILHKKKQRRLVHLLLK